LRSALERLESTIAVAVTTEVQTAKIIETYTGGNSDLLGTYTIRLEIDTSVV
jgi:hypothetical protein